MQPDKLDYIVCCLHSLLEILHPTGFVRGSLGGVQLKWHLSPRALAGRHGGLDRLACCCLLALCHSLPYLRSIPGFAELSSRPNCPPMLNPYPTNVRRIDCFPAAAFILCPCWPETLRYTLVANFLVLQTYRFQLHALLACAGSLAEAQMAGYGRLVHPYRIENLGLYP